MTDDDRSTAAGTDRDDEYGAEDADESDGTADSAELPESVVEEAERLTRLARDAVDPDEATAARERRSDLLDDYAFVARERDDDVLVLHPAEWVADGSVRVERIDDTERAVEVPLEEPADDADWESVDAHNQSVVAAVRERHGDVHGDNAAAFADFMGNHYLKPIEEATDRMRAEFLAEYFPRNAWPSDDQRAVVEESVEKTMAVARE
ncbi:rnhA operon protein [Halomarina salina]|uniref:RnhA operon protein n=1 Tax=Halomarina salina TaxID=1872699 RepID=A0ABD5RJ55_9EURY|nr:rnhA operon protein [Halomarina salina]